jgi:hypothetical protein
MGKFALIYECFGLRARFWNELCSQTKVPLYFYAVTQDLNYEYELLLFIGSKYLFGEFNML